MPLKVDVFEATDIKSNQMTLNGELIDMSEYELVLCYFEYGKKPDLSDAIKSTRCALLDRPDKYSLIQGNVEDNSTYYFRAVVQNFAEAETQMEHLKNIVFLDWCDVEYFNNLRIMNTIVNSSKSLTTLLSCKNAMYSVFSSNNSGVLWTGRKEIGKNYVNVYAYAFRSNTISLVKPIDLTPYKTLYIDWGNLIDGWCNSKALLKINNETALLREGRFERTIDSIDINSINGTFNIDIVGDGTSGDRSNIYIYSLWLE